MLANSNRVKRALFTHYVTVSALTPEFHVLELGAELGRWRLLMTAGLPNGTFKDPTKFGVALMFVVVESTPPSFL